MPFSHQVAGCSGSNVNDIGRLAMVSEPTPSWFHVVPPSVLTHRPFPWPWPASIHRLPHCPGSRVTPVHSPPAGALAAAGALPPTVTVTAAVVEPCWLVAV